LGIEGKTIVIVDDDPELRILEKRVIEGAGMKFLEADTVDNLLKVLQTNSPHLIVLDLNMPGMSGLDYLKMAATNPKLKSIPVLVLSGHSKPAVVREALALGAKNYMVKPFVAKTILQKIRKIFLDLESLTFRFGEKSRPKVTARVSGEFLRLGVDALQIESGVRFKADSVFELHSSVLTQFDLNCLAVQLLNHIIENTDDGRYRQLGKLKGLKKETKDSIRTTLRQWRRK